jgi:dienelactone hydrolase
VVLARRGRDQAGLTSLEYRLLAFSAPLPPAAQQRHADAEADTMVESRHVGIVALTKDQALTSLSTSGVAVRSVPWIPGKYPVVVILGGQYYLSTTAEVLASHGFVVVAPFRFRDQRNEIGTDEFTRYMENAVRDAEWAIDELRAIPAADPARIGALGHGGGGLQALLLAMRHRSISALANIDASNFSRRTNARQIPFYHPPLLRVPYLYLAAAATRQTQDLFDEFLAMRGSDRFEVILREEAVRHHDLSDLGRGVTALGLRGENQAAVQRAYAGVQEIVVRFFQSAHTDAGRARFEEWLRDESSTGSYTVERHR